MYRSALCSPKRTEVSWQISDSRHQNYSPVSVEIPISTIPIRMVIQFSRRPHDQMMTK